MDGGEHIGKIVLMPLAPGDPRAARVQRDGRWREPKKRASGAGEVGFRVRCSKYLQHRGTHPYNHLVSLTS